MIPPNDLRAKAALCRALASDVADVDIARDLCRAAAWFDAEAEQLVAASPEPAAAPPEDEAEPIPRTATRHDVSIVAVLRRQGQSRFEARIEDLSETGFRVGSHFDMPVDSMVFLTLPGLAPVPARVAWSSGSSLGCQFHTPLHPAVLDRVLAAGA